MILRDKSEPFQIVQAEVIPEPDGKYIVGITARHDDGRIKGVDFLLEPHRSDMWLEYDIPYAVETIRRMFAEGAPNG